MELMAFNFNSINSMKLYEMKFQCNFRLVGLHFRPQGLRSSVFGLRVWVFIFDTSEIQ